MLTVNVYLPDFFISNGAVFSAFLVLPNATFPDAPVSDFINTFPESAPSFPVTALKLTVSSFGPVCVTPVMTGAGTSAHDFLFCAEMPCAAKNAIATDIPSVMNDFLIAAPSFLNVCR
jgi:hypothetical protein